MASVFDVAQYILEKMGTMTTMKLQRLLYYSQAWSLAWDEVPLFNEEFEAWANGPVCREVYDLHKEIFSISGISQGDAENLSNVEIETIDAVLQHYGDKSPHWLRELTHLERPWKKTRNLCISENSCNTIAKELMQEYYRDLR